jgi:hypothetical protein
MFGMASHATQASRTQSYSFPIASMVRDSFCRLCGYEDLAMMVTAHFSELARGNWYEYASRFLIGGLVTAGAGIMAKQFGPAVGGLFLALPAIFPASVTLIEKHERQKKEQHGLTGVRRGKEAAAVDAAGAALGSCGLFIFAVVVWKLLPNHSAWFALPAAAASWTVVSALAWFLSKRYPKFKNIILRAS